MFIRRKTFKNKDGSTRTYLQLVESVRQGGRVRQRVVASLGRLEDLQDGRLDALIENLARFSQSTWRRLEEQAERLNVRWSKQWGPTLIFERLWREAELDKAFEALLEDRQLAFDVAEAVFTMVLNRLTDPCSKRGLVRQWLQGVYRPQAEQLELHHYYRALDVLAEHKEAIEDRLFARARDLFWTEVDVVMWDATSTYFEGRGPEGLAAYGYSRDKRPDRPQRVVGVLMTRDGYPIAHELFPGDTADKATVESVLDALKRRFHLRRVIFVADRGMVSRQILRAIEEAGMEYIVGMPLRRHREAEAVLSQPGRYRVIDEQLRIKQVIRQGQRYILCHNPLQAEHDRQAREAVLAHLKQRIERGQAKDLLRNRLVARYLKALPQGALVVDADAVKRAARYDGKYLLRTHTDLDPEAVVRAYKDLWRVERAFRTLKSALDLRPMFHWTERRVRGHVMVCFLALVLESLLWRKLRQQNPGVSYDDVLHDLSQLHAVAVELDGEAYLTRTELVGQAFEAFKAVGLRPPARVQPMPRPETTPAG